MEGCLRSIRRQSNPTKAKKASREAYMVGHRGDSEVAAVAPDQVLPLGDFPSSARNLPFYPDLFGIWACCGEAIRLSEGFVPYLQAHNQVQARRRQRVRSRPRAIPLFQ